MYRKQISHKASPSVRSTAKSQETAPSSSYGSLSGVVQRVQQDPNSVSENERQQLESAIGTRSTQEILAGTQTSWVPEFQGISTQLWGDAGQVGVPIQAKLTIGEAGDKYEQQADQIASQVVEDIHAPTWSDSTQTQSVQRQDEPKQEIQSKPSISGLQPEASDIQTPSILQRREEIGTKEASTDLESAINTARGSGQPLDSSLKQSMGQAMGADFSGVRVHTDVQADQLNQSIQARAFTTGQDMFFRQGKYQPESRDGQELIAHELTHVMQQGSISCLQSKPIKISSNTNNVIQRDEEYTFLGLNKSHFASQEDFQTRENKRLNLLRSNRNKKRIESDLLNTLRKYSWNWFKLKEDLAYKKSGETEKEYEIKLNRMKELVMYRSQIVNNILEETLSKIKEKHEDLDNFDIKVGNTGSITYTSDIDITIEIKNYPQLEYEVVELFNQVFREKYGVASGVMLDTNLYTNGFMPAENLYKDKFKQQTAQERLLIDDAKIQKHRIQLALSFLSIRQYFGTSRKGKLNWYLFKRKTKDALHEYLANISQKNGSEEDIIKQTLILPALDDVQAIFEETESLYQQTEAEIKQEKDKQILDNKVTNNIQQDLTSVELHLDTQAKDKLYVETLKKVSTILEELKENAEILDDELLIPDDSLPVVQETRINLLKRRAELIVAFEKEQGKALIYANEAYFSGGAAYHVVKGMQGGAKVQINRQQKMQSILMNIGYKLQHFKHKQEHNGRGRALIDTSKYGQRVSDLALLQNANSGQAEESLFGEISEKSLNFLAHEIELVTQYKNKDVVISPKKEPIKTPTAKEDAAARDFPEMTMENVENAFLEIAYKTLGPYYWDKYKTNGRLWASEPTGYHYP